MTIIYVLIGLVSILYFQKCQYERFLIGYMALMTNLFMLLPNSGGLKGSDIALAISIILIIINRNQSGIRHFKDKYRKYVITLIIFTLLELLYTVATGADSIGWAIKVARVPLLISTFFVIRMIPLANLRKFLRYAFYITIIDGILFYLEFLGLDTLPDVNPNKGLTMLGFSSECNVPILSFIFLFCCLSNQIVTKYRIFFLIFFIGILLLTFVRTYLLAFIICAFIYLYIQKVDKSLIVKYALAAIVLYPLMTYIFNKKDQAAGADSGSDIQNIVSGDFLDPTTNIHCANGTFAFRISMLAERVQYLIDNPRYLLQGIGMINEGSPNCSRRFHFILGSPSTDSFKDICIIESGDNTWVPIVLRYGLIGTFLYMYFFFIIYKSVKDRRDEFVIFAPITVFYFLISFSGSFFDRADRYIIICLLLGILSRVEFESD